MLILTKFDIYKFKHLKIFDHLQFLLLKPVFDHSFIIFKVIHVFLNFFDLYKLIISKFSIPSSSCFRRRSVISRFLPLSHTQKSKNTNFTAHTFRNLSIVHLKIFHDVYFLLLKPECDHLFLVFELYTNMSIASIYTNCTDQNSRSHVVLASQAGA